VIASASGSGSVRLNLAVPVFVRGGAAPRSMVARPVVGAVVLVSEPWKAMLPFIIPEIEPTRTSETLLVWNNGSDAAIFCPLRWARGEASLFQKPLTDATLEVRVAQQGDVAFGEFTDYRGLKVFGAGRRIALAGDNLVRKVNRDEALSEYNQRALLEALVGALSILLFGFVMLTQHRKTAMQGLRDKVRQQRALLKLKQHVEVPKSASPKPSRPAPWFTPSHL